MKTQKRTNGPCLATCERVSSEVRLTEAQRRVVHHQSGPLLVMSGAGTGKTHVMTSRMLHLVSERGVDPESILALTFTEKAALEMQGRVEGALPISHMLPVIKTFHSLGEMLLRRSGIEIGISPDFKILQDIDLLLFLRRHVHAFAFHHYRSMGNPIGFLRVFHAYVSRLQDEDITPQKYLDHARDLKQKASNEEEKEHAEKHMELANAYGSLQTLILREGYLDFPGLIHYTLRLLETRPSVLAALRETYSHILVDEFQDTNHAQLKLVSMLAEKHRNIIVVGDDDQAIYKWRGASLANAGTFKSLFPEFKTVVLKDNFRSGQKILDGAYALIQHNNPGRLETLEGVDKKLISVVPRAERPILLSHFAESADEVEFICTQATSALKKGLDTAILVRTNALGAPFLAYLKSHAVPSHHFAPSAFFSAEAIKDLLAVIRVTADPSDDLALYRLLTMPLFALESAEILIQMKRARNQNLSLYQLLSQDQFLKVKKLIDHLIDFSRTHSVADVIGAFLDMSGYLDTVSDEYIRDIADFSEHVSAFVERNMGRNSAVDFLSYVAIIEEGGDFRAESANMDREEIKILTIHGAKGLEFDAVFIPGLVKGKFPQAHRSESLEIPEGLMPEVASLGDYHLQEERRLLYVACTRARELCHLSYSDFYGGKRMYKPSPFVQELLEARVVTVVGETKKRSAPQDSLPFTIGAADRPHRAIKLDISKLSYTQIDTFHTCPLKYQFRYLFEIPTPPVAALSFGSTVHNTLRDFHIALSKEDLPRPVTALSSLMHELYEKNWIPYGYGSRADQEAQKAHGRKLLRRYIESEALGQKIPVFIEKSFTLGIGPICIKGRIDRIDRLDDGTYEVIDYKTGRPRKEKLDDNVQLSLYALACKNVLHLPVSKLSLLYLEDLSKISTTRSADQLSACEKEIEGVAREMSGSDFSPTPGFHCGYCEYRLICPAAMVSNRA